jgi:hypothetical protein
MHCTALSNSGIYFGLWDTIKEWLPGKEAGPMKALVAKALAAQAVAITAGGATYPFDTGGVLIISSILYQSVHSYRLMIVCVSRTVVYLCDTSACNHE